MLSLTITSTSPLPLCYVMLYDAIPSRTAPSRATGNITEWNSHASSLTGFSKAGTAYQDQRPQKSDDVLQSDVM